MSSVLSGLSTILLFLALPVALALAGVALAGLFAFGGARRNALPLLATGVYGALTGAFYLYGVVASHFALQDNAYLGNLYVGLTFLLLGVAGLLVGGLVGAGLNRLVALGLVIVALIGLVGVYRSVGLDLPYGGQFVAAYLAAALTVMTGALVALRRADLIGPALGMGALGALAAIGVYSIVGGLLGADSLGVYTQFGVDHALADKPPVLEGFGALVTLLLAVAVYLAGRRWRGGEGSFIPRATAPV